jgi:predicted DNA-binding WGR domain protein
MSLIHLRLRALDWERNIDRDYDILVMRVLFGFWGVTVAFGRHGTRGSFRNHVFETQEEAQRFVYKSLQRRLRAPKRIGCSYCFVSSETSTDQDLSSWLAPEHRRGTGF